MRIVMVTHFPVNLVKPAGGVAVGPIALLRGLARFPDAERHVITDRVPRKESYAVEDPRCTVHPVPQALPAVARRIHILSVCPQLTTGGAERQLLYFCKHIDRARFDVRVVYYEGAGGILSELSSLGVPVVHLDRRQLGGVGLVRALRREISAQPTDVLDCRLPSGYRFGRLAALGAGVPVIVAQERTIAGGHGVRRWFDRLCNLWTDAWVGNSKAVAEHIARNLHVRGDRIHVIYNGIDADRFRGASEHPLLSQLRQEGRRVVLNVGGLRPAKNQRLFLRVCDRLRRSRDDLAFAICGGGALRPRLEAYAVKLGLVSRCHFLGHQEDVAPVLAAADVFVQTSDREGMPNAVMEAMAANVPVVATDVGGTRELIEDGVTGLLVPMGDEDALVTATARLLSDRDLGSRFAEAAARKIREHFSVEAMARAYAALLNHLVGEKRCPAAGAKVPSSGRGGDRHRETG